MKNENLEIFETLFTKLRNLENFVKFSRFLEQNLTPINCYSAGTRTGNLVKNGKIT
jgi:hypothetical protein